MWLGTYSGKVPAYNALQACKGAMFFLPVPLNITLETLSEIHDMVTLPDPELFIILNGARTVACVCVRACELSSFFDL